MASLSSSPLLLLLLLLSMAFSGVIADWPLPYNFTYVCDEKRYANLNLQISHFSFCDKSLSYPVRAKHLVDSMTLAEKVRQLGNNHTGQWHASASGVPRLGLPAYNWWSEALHGVSDVGGGSTFEGPLVKGATSFPLPITTAAAFNQSLWKRIGQVVSTEARAMNNLGVAGLTFWSPNINLVRDPRWGRALETPGEDPFAAGVYAVNYVRGLQDVEGRETTSDPNARPLKVSACCKHYAAYDLDLWKNADGSAFDRHFYNANVTERDMIESYLKPFEMCVKDGDVSSVMCSYNNINGVPACADAGLLRGVIRGEWDLHGYIVSDCDSVDTMFSQEKFLNDEPEDAAAQSMWAGLDLDCGYGYPHQLEKAVKRGLVKESDIDNALFNNYLVLFRLGYFDGNPLYDSLNASHVCSTENMKVAADAARQGIVLLKNNNTRLPLSSHKYRKIAVVGPHANATEVMRGNYAGIPCRYVSPIEGFKKYADVVYEQGCVDVRCNTEEYVFPAMRAAREADATVVVVGLSLDFEREDLDREDFELPGYQNKLISQVQSVANGPVIIVILCAGGVNVSEYATSPLYDSIIWAGYPGQEGGQAIADIVFGAHNPDGRLTTTWYASDYLSRLPMSSQQFRPNDELGYPGRTYRFYNGSSIFPFGSGLSYTTFNYTLLSTQKMVAKTLSRGQHCQMLHYNATSYVPPCPAALVSDLSCENDITIEVLVSNNGKWDGGNVVTVYSRPPAGVIGAPIKQLVAFQKVFVKAGQSETVKFELSSCKSLVFVTETAYEVVPMGENTFIIGGDADDTIEFPFHVYLKKEN